MKEQVFLNHSIFIAACACLQGVVEFEKLSKALEGVDLTPEERQNLDELQQYLVQGEGSWVLGDDFLAFIGTYTT